MGVVLAPIFYKKYKKYCIYMRLFMQKIFILNFFSLKKY